MKKIIIALLTLSLLICFGCAAPADNGDQTEAVSIDPADYDITEDMLTCAEGLPDFSDFPMEKLGAYLLNTDAAGSEGAGEELYSRFMSDPEKVLDYLKSLGDIQTRNGTTAREAISKALATAAVWWHNAGDEFSGIINNLKETLQDPDSIPILTDLFTEFETAKANANL